MLMRFYDRLLGADDLTEYQDGYNGGPGSVWPEATPLPFDERPFRRKVALFCAIFGVIGLGLMRL